MPTLREPGARRNGWTGVPNAVWDDVRDHRLDPKAAHIFQVLRSFIPNDSEAAGRGDLCWASITKIAERGGCSERTAWRHIADLERRGHIEIRKRGGNGPGDTSCYYVPLLEG